MPRTLDNSVCRVAAHRLLIESRTQRASGWAGTARSLSGLIARYPRASRPRPIAMQPRYPPHGGIREVAVHISGEAQRADLCSPCVV